MPQIFSCLKHCVSKCFRREQQDSLYYLYHVRATPEVTTQNTALLPRTYKDDSASILMEISSIGESVRASFNQSKFSFELVPTNRKEKIGDFVPRNNNYFLFYYDAQKQNGLKALTKRLQKVFKRKDQHIILRFIDPHRLIHRMCAFTCARNTTQLIIQKSTITSEEVEFIRDNFYSIKRLTLGCSAPLTHPDFGLQYEKVRLTNAYLTVRNLSMMKCISLDVTGSNLTTTDINEFLKHWMRYKTPKYIRVLTITGVQDHQNLYDGIRLENWDPSWRRNEGEKEIFRDDGVLASLAFRDGKFSFFVWSQRYELISGDSQYHKVHPMA